MNIPKTWAIIQGAIALLFTCAAVHSIWHHDPNGIIGAGVVVLIAGGAALFWWRLED